MSTCLLLPKEPWCKAGNIFNLQYMSYRLCANWVLHYICYVFHDGHNVYSLKGGVYVGVRVRSSAVDGLQLLLSSRALSLKCFSRFIKLCRCLRQSPEWLISFAPRCWQNLWSKHPESAPGGSRRVMCSFPLVSHCLGQSTIITSLWSPWFSYALASLKQLHITRAECWMVSDGAINIPSIPLICNMENCIWMRECIIPAALALSSALWPFS